MTYKDCIHYEVCGTLTNPCYPDEANKSEILCNNFKNKSDFRKVTRCEKCKYKETCEQYLYIDSNRTELVYCSYGERRDT